METPAESSWWPQGLKVEHISQHENTHPCQARRPPKATMTQFEQMTGDLSVGRLGCNQRDE